MNDLTHQVLADYLEQEGLPPEKAERVSALFDLIRSVGIDIRPDQLFRIFKRQVTLHKVLPTTIQNNIARSATLLDLTVKEFVTAGIRQPQLLCHKPDTLRENTEGSAQALGVGLERYKEAAKKQPQLFYQYPQTVVSKQPYMIAIAHQLKDSRSFDELMISVPSSICRSATFLHACLVLAANGLGPKNFHALTTLHSKAPETLLVPYFKAKIAETGQGRRALQVMCAKNIVEDLPPDIEPIAREDKAYIRASSKVMAVA